MRGGYFIFIMLCAVSLFASCTSVDLYEKDTAIPDYKWKSDFPATGEFSITDTAAAYRVFVVLRHTDAYRYNNIWLLAGLQSPGDSMRFQKINLSLGSDASGWEGTGMNDIWEVRKLILPHPENLHRGVYKFRLLQLMREDPLEHVMSAGLRIEKVAR